MTRLSSATTCFIWSVLQKKNIYQPANKTQVLNVFTVGIKASRLGEVCVQAEQCPANCSCEEAATYALDGAGELRECGVSGLLLTVYSSLIELN